MDSYQTYIAKSRYARYLPQEERRETWDETISRYLDFFEERGQLDKKTRSELFEAIYNLEVCPSMRALMTAGPALARDNMAGFNCSYLTIDHPRAFDELLYVLLCGTGVGFSVERQYINKLPEVDEQFYETESTIQVADSKIGWAKSYKELISLLYNGQVPKYDLSNVRAAGTTLKTFGGRASGAGPLRDLFEFTIDTFRQAAGRKLTSLECHSLACKIAQSVVVGGVRRSALISLSNLTDDRIRRAKHGQWWVDSPYLALSNNSACYTEKPDFEGFLAEWHALYESRSGERGMFSRAASKVQAAKNGRRDTDHDFGTNPCSEIILRPNQVCNLSEVVVRANDTQEDLLRKIRLATILGTLQSSLTDFRYLRPIWKRNTEEECLLGVSLTGIMDNKLMSGKLGKDKLKAVLTELKNESIKVNKTWAKKLGVNQSTAITAVKPSGTVSQLVDSASGIHGRFAEYYIRRVRADIKDPLCEVLKTAGVPHEVDITNPATLVFDFFQKAPQGSVIASEQTAMEQLEIWKIYQDYYTEHKPSITVYYKDSEFLEVGQWLYNNFDSVSGVSFLPYSDHTYQQAPYEKISKEEYEAGIKSQPKSLNWDIIEQSDVTEGVQTLSCHGGACEL